MKIIVAVNKLGYIGLNNRLPWRSSEDLRHFKKLTLDKTLLVGKTTFENMPKLEGREVIVVGTGYNTLEEALTNDIDYIIGGKRLIESVFNNYRHLITGVELSIINDETIGDCKIDIDFSDYFNVNYYYFNINKNENN